MKLRDIYLIPLFWCLGISSLAYQALAVVRWSNGRKKYRFPPAAKWLFAYVIVYLVSLLANFADADGQRWISSLYNWTFWVMGLLLINYIFNLDHLDISADLEKPARLMLLLMGTVALVTFFLQEAQSIPSILGIAFDAQGFPPLIRDTLELKIFASDWFDGHSSIRNSIFSPYSTATAAMGMLLLSLAIIREKLVSWQFGLYFFLTLLVVLSTYSRLSVACLFAFLILLATIRLPFGLVLIGSVITAIAVGLMLSLFLEIWQDMNELRAGSSSVRFLMYEETIKLAMREGPLWGVGVKSRDVFFIPLGSHSTYLGVLLKTGMIGLFCMIMFQLSILQLYGRALTSKFSAGEPLIAMLTAMILFLAFEDLDAAQPLCFLYFYVLAIYLRLASRGQND